MILPITVEMVEHIYSYLSCCPPFDKFSMPPAEDVKFKIIKTRRLFARYYAVGDKHHIEVSCKLVGSHMVLLTSVAHELIHLHLNEVDACDEHGPNFQMIADEVCAIHGFDRLTF